MKYILAKHKSGFKKVLLDNDIYYLVKDKKWYLRKGKNDSTFYVERRENNKTVILHRLILPNSIMVDHIDGNGLNNQRSNLRSVTSLQNAWNSKKRRDNTSGYKGVNYHKQHGRYNARIQYNKTRIELGLFKTAKEAAEAYDKAATKYFGEYAKLNFPKKKVA